MRVQTLQTGQAESEFKWSWMYRRQLRVRLRPAALATQCCFHVQQLFHSTVSAACRLPSDTRQRESVSVGSTIQWSDQNHRPVVFLDEQTTYQRRDVAVYSSVLYRRAEPRSYSVHLAPLQSFAPRPADLTDTNK